MGSASPIDSHTIALIRNDVCEKHNRRSITMFGNLELGGLIKTKNIYGGTRCILGLSFSGVWVCAW